MSQTGRSLWLAVAIALVLLGRVWAQGEKSPLDALPQCEVDRVALQAQLVELRAQLVAAQTALDRQALATERARIEGTLPKVDGQRWDWTALRYVPAAPGAQGPK